MAAVYAQGRTFGHLRGSLSDVAGRLSSGLRAGLRSALCQQVRDAIVDQAGRLPTTTGLHLALQERHQQVTALRHSLSAVAADLDLLGAPFSGGLTMDQAWRRHPGAAAVFAAYDLPACDGCAVRFDETLEEAAGAYGLDLSLLLVDLNALLRCGGRLPADSAADSAAVSADLR